MVMITSEAIIGNSGALGVGDSELVGIEEESAVVGVDEDVVDVGPELAEATGVGEEEEDAELAVTVPLTTVAVMNSEVPPEP